MYISYFYWKYLMEANKEIKSLSMYSSVVTAFFSSLDFNTVICNFPSLHCAFLTHAKSPSCSLYCVGLHRSVLMACQVWYIDVNNSFVRFNGAAVVARFGWERFNCCCTVWVEISPLFFQGLGRKHFRLNTTLAISMSSMLHISPEC